MEKLSINPEISEKTPQNIEFLSTDPRLVSQANEIFSFRGEAPRQTQENQENRAQIADFPAIVLREEESLRRSQEIAEDDEDLEEVSSLLAKMVKSNLVFQVFFLFFFANCLWGLDFKVLLGLSWVNDSINCFICAEKLWYSKNKRKCCLFSKLKLKLFDNFVLISYKLMVFAYILDREFPLHLGLLLLVSQIFSQIAYILYMKFCVKKSILSEFIELGFRLYVLLQILMISLNVQGILQWKWRDVFWCFWVIFSILTGATLGFTLIFLGKLYQKCFEKVDNYERLRNFLFFS